MVDDEDWYGGFGGFEFEAELFLHGGEDGGRSVQGCGGGLVDALAAVLSGVHCRVKS
jgi:hypothetical protein